MFERNRENDISSIGACVAIELATVSGAAQSETCFMTRTTVLFLMLANAATLLAQDANTNQRDVTDLESQLQAEHEHVQELNNALQQLQQQVNQLKNGNARATSSQPAGENGTSHQPAGTTTALGGTTSSSNPDQPLAIRFRGITLAPGGFLDATGIFRTRNENADVDSTFGSIPLAGTANAGLSEFRGTGRATRFSLLAQGK